MARAFAEYSTEEKLAMMTASEAAQRRTGQLLYERKLECESLLGEALLLLQQAKHGKPYKRAFRRLQHDVAVYFEPL